MIRKIIKKIKSRLRARHELNAIFNLISKDLKWIIFCDSPGPTYQISFKTPFEHKGYSENVDFITISEKETEILVKNNTLNKFLNITSTKSQLKAVVFSRYAHSAGLEIITHYRNKKTKTINHLDDFLLEVPKCLGPEIYNRLNKKEKIQTRTNLIKDADLNYISTNFLKNKLSAQFNKSKFYSGIYASYTSFENNKQKNKKIKIGYMGSKGHVRDFAPIIPKLARVLEENDNIIFEFFGTIKPPTELSLNFPNQVVYHPPQKNYQDFLKKLNSLNWDIGLIPLINDEWNNCKAPTKFIEYSMCNIPVIASNTIVYKEAVQDSKSIIFVDNNKWYEAITRASQDQKLLQETLLQAQILCENKFNKQILADQVFRVINEL